MKKIILLVSIISCNIHSFDLKETEQICNKQKMKIVVIDFNKIYRESIELEDMQKRLEKEFLENEKKVDLYLQQAEINPNLEYPIVENYNWHDELKAAFRKKIQPIIEKIAKKYGAHIILASKIWDDFRWDVFCLDKSYDITDEVIKSINAQYKGIR